MTVRGRTSLTFASTPAISAAAEAADRTDAMSDIANRGSSTSSVLCPQPPLSVESTRAGLGLLIPSYPTSLPQSQTVTSGYSAVLFRPLTLASGVTLTIETGGFMAITNLTYNAAA